MVLIVGLGNPGNEYSRTRHNIGFMVVDLLAASLDARFQPGKGEFWQAQCSLKNIGVTVLKPVTFMNNSGRAVQEFLEQYETALADVLIVCDDFQLPIGTIRLRSDGSDSGHHGLSSVIYHLQTDQFARLRCGIASASMPPEKSKMKDFVLDQFPESELRIVETMIERARDACLSFITDGTERTMNKFNSKPPEELFT
ncbi:MAG: aminoacyl-tRNA hydrolase [Ignavibacteriae bacterium]|nr:MAG: aminoacyl-tRNA hydrolase [Ignavibacteriota bacterium]